MASKMFGWGRGFLLGVVFGFAALLANQSVGKEWLDPRVAKLNLEVKEVKDGMRIEYRRARNMLEFCGEQGRVRNVGWDQLVEICTDAQKRVDECKAYRADWYRRTNAVLADQALGVGETYTDRIVVKDDMGNPQLDPKTGKPITEARSEMRGVGPQPDQEQRNNDYVYWLRNAELEDCPYTVPGVSRDGYSLTPAGALEFWKEQDNKPLPGAVMQRKTSGATSTMLAAAVGQANEEGVIRDAEEEAAEKERQRLAKIKAEQDRLARIEADRQAKERARQSTREELVKDIIFACAVEARDALNVFPYDRDGESRRMGKRALTENAAWAAWQDNPQGVRSRIVAQVDDDIRRGVNSTIDATTLCFLRRRDEQRRGVRLLSSPFSD